MSKFVPCDRSQPFLLPPDLREWLPDDDVAHLIIAAVDRVDIRHFKVNERGTGSAQYHPHVLLSLLIYGYAHGMMSSRKIERACYRDVAMRYIAANQQPDHDTICKFRRENAAAIEEAFVQVLLLAQEVGVLQVGQVSVDGTKVDANASKRRSIRYDRIEPLRERLSQDIADLMAQAEAADVSASDDGERLPEAIARRERLRAKLDEAAQRLEREARERAAAEQPNYEAKVAAREARSGRRKGKQIKPPDDTPPGSAQTNLTDGDSGLMRKNKHSEYRQSYNAQAVVDADGSQLVLGARVSSCGSDRRELVADIGAVDERLGSPQRVLADSGYATESEVEALESKGIDVLVATGSEDRRRRYDFRPETPPRERPTIRSPWIKAMNEKLRDPLARVRYRKRQQTVEPVFGIIKNVMQLVRFSLRGRHKVGLEWQLTTLAYNCKRLHNLLRPIRA